MTYNITDQCIACGKCESHCPTGAISKKSNGKFSIDTNLCNDCVGSYGVAQCAAGCPTFDGCTPTVSSLLQSTLNSDNYWDNWFATYDRLISRLKAKKETKYWHNWFDTYSQKLDTLIHT